MTSAFTELAMKDAKREFGDTAPTNVYLNIDTYIQFEKLLRQKQSK